MNKLPHDKRTQILTLLCEGASMRLISRTADVSINTVSKLLADAGKACSAFHDAKIRNVKAWRVQVDEIWSFTHTKATNVPAAKAAPAGDTWTWTAIEVQYKLIVSWLIGGRDGEYAMEFMDDLCSRLANRVQLTSDGHRAYLEAIEGAFGSDISHAQLVNLYGADPDSAKGRYSSAECTGIHKERIEGNPDPEYVSTSYAERQNFTMQSQMRRFTRPTNAFSKKLENHMHMAALYAVYYNWTRIHKTLRLTPAMAAGLADRLWTMGDIAEMIEAAAPKSGHRGLYKKREILEQTA